MERSRIDEGFDPVITASHTLGAFLVMRVSIPSLMLVNASAVQARTYISRPINCIWRALRASLLRNSLGEFWILSVRARPHNKKAEMIDVNLSRKDSNL